jgi:hypothetical protein
MRLNQYAGLPLPHAPCQPGFVAGPKHLKDKFCGSCRSGFYVPYSHIRAIHPAKADEVR